MSDKRLRLIGEDWFPPVLDKVLTLINLDTGTFAVDWDEKMDLLRQPGRIAVVWAGREYSDVFEVDEARRVRWLSDIEAAAQSGQKTALPAPVHGGRWKGWRD